MAYGIVKVDNITFDNGGSDQNVTVSGLYRATTSGVTVSGTIAAGTVSGVTVIGSTTVSGATVTGTTANFTSGNFSNIISSAATMSGALIMANQQQVRFREAVGNGVNHIALQAPAIVSADQTITLPDQTGTVVTTGDNGSVSSTMLATNLTISAAAGSAAAPSIAFTGDPNTGIYSPGADTLAFVEGGTEAMRIDSSGRLLRGTSTAAETVSISSAPSTPSFQNASTSQAGSSAGLFNWSTATSGAYLNFSKSKSGTIGTRGQVSSGDDLGSVLFAGDDGTNFVSSAGILAEVDGTPGTDNMPGRLVLRTKAAGATGTPAERMRITSDGSVGIGTTSPTATLDVNGDVKLASLNGGPLAGFRNRIINGNFDIWQRGTSFSNPADGSYTADRWVIFYNGSGATRTVSQQIFDPGLTEAAPGSVFFLRHAQTVAGSGGTYNAVNQRMEGVRTYEGQTVTLSFYARGTSASLTLSTIQLRQNFGAGGSAEVFTTVASSVVIAGSTFARYTYTVTVPSITGKTVGTSAFLELIFNLPVNNTFSLDIASVQLEPGPVATPFEQRPIGTELALCQRYFQRMTNTIRGVITTPTLTRTTLNYFYPVQLRATPNATILSPVTGASGKLRNEDSASDVDCTIFSAGIHAVSAVDANTSLTAGTCVSAMFTVSAEL
jgi:hypothetical protein